MKVDFAFICQHAERIDNGEAINALGIGLRRYITVPSLPVKLKLFVVANIRCKASEASKHVLTLSVADNEGNKIPAPTDVHVDAALSDDRSDSFISIVYDLQLQMKRLGRHTIGIIIDGEQLHMLDFTLQ